MDNPEVVVVGGGPAGLTAGIYSARAGHRTLVLEKYIIGGQISRTPEVENYPGFAEPVVAMELAQAMEAQARRAGTELEAGEVSRLSAAAGGLALETSLGRLQPSAVVIASGVESRELGVKGERELRGRGVSYCAICDGPLFRGKEVAVVGGGDSALDEALYLAGICSRVHIIHRRDEFRGAKVAQDRLHRLPNVRFWLSCIVTGISGSSRLESLEVTNKKDGSTTALPVSGLFVYVGSIPNTAWCQGTVDLDENGFVQTDGLLRTNAPGVFAAGDVRVTPLRQIATAVGDGALAGMSCHHFLLDR